MTARQASLLDVAALALERRVAAPAADLLADLADDVAFVAALALERRVAAAAAHLLAELADEGLSASVGDQDHGPEQRGGKRR